LRQVQALDVPVCCVCGDLLVPALSGDNRVCPGCAQDEPPYRRALAFGSYQGVLRELIHLLKYHRVRAVAALLGRWLSEIVAAQLAPEDLHSMVVVPVPLHPAKQRQRGFNQAELLAQAIVKRLRSEGVREARILRRRRPTMSQTGLTREQRGLNVRGAFAAESARRVAGRNVLLVDDVLTTGATIFECSRVLLRAGATGIWVATVARVLAPGQRRPDEMVIPSREAAVRFEKGGGIAPGRWAAEA